MKTIRDDPKTFISDGCWEWAHDPDDESEEEQKEIEDSEDSVFTMEDKQIDDEEDFDSEGEIDDESEE